MAIHRIHIEAWRPALLNELVGRDAHAIHRIKKRDRKIVAQYATLFNVPRVGLPPETRRQAEALGIAHRIEDLAGRRRRVALEIADRYSTFPDDDAPWKSLLDALVQCGLLVDDSREWCETVNPPTYRRARKRSTVITLEDL